MNKDAPDGFMDVPAGRVAAIVTSLEMAVAPEGNADFTQPPGVEFQHIAHPTAEWYLRLFRLVGEDWLWFSRLRLSEGELAAIIHNRDVEVYVLRLDGLDAGILELDFRDANQCEIVYFGLIGAHVGKGLGHYLMREAIARAWAKPIKRLWVHTCTLDHPSALQFYRRAGFQPFRQQVEIAIDPRTNGELPRTAGSHVPIFDV